MRRRRCNGEVTEAVRTLAQELASIELRAAKIEVGEVIDSALGADFEAQIQRIFGPIGGAIAEGTEEGLAEARRVLAEAETDISPRASDRRGRGRHEFLRHGRKQYAAA